MARPPSSASPVPLLAKQPDELGRSINGAARDRPCRPHPVPPQQAVLVLRQPRQLHEQDPLLGPACFSSDGEHLRG